MRGGGETGKPGAARGEAAEEDALAKADPHLRQELEKGGGEDRLRVVVLLRGASESEDGQDEPPPRPSDHPDRPSWRRALLEHRQRRVASDLSPVRRALEELGLEVRGGATGGAVVVDGPAGLIRKALHLPGIRKATLDREIHLRPPPGED